MYFTDFQLCIFHEAQHNKNIALYEHIQIMRHMQCFVLGSVGFQKYQADSTAQCMLQFSVAYNELQYAIQCNVQGKHQHRIQYYRHNT